MQVKKTCARSGLSGLVRLSVRVALRRRLRRARAVVRNQARARVEQPPAPRGRHARVQAPARTAPAHACAANLDEAAERGIFRIADVDDIDWKTVLKIGCFQVLAIVPGTSRSGATIIGGMLCGCSRTAAAEFTFFLAIPVMFGWGVLKLIKYLMAVGLAMTATEIAVLVVGIVTAFVVSVISIKFLMGYIKKNDFTAFGVYRIIVGLVVLAYFGVKVLL